MVIFETLDRRRSRRGGRLPAGGLAVVLGLALALPVAGQTVLGYARTPGDTLRYHVLNESENSSRGSRGGTSSDTRREYTLALAFGTGDTARAWLEAFSGTAKVQGHETTMNAEGLLDRPFAVLFRANGDAQVLSAPTAPGRGGANPQALLGDVVLRLPARPLAPGVEWADTLGAGKQVRPDGATVESQLIRRYKVVRDTVVAGARALVITVKGEGSNSQTSQGAAGGTVNTSTYVSETGRIVFATDPGRLLFWDRTTQTSGRTSTSGAGDNSRANARNPTGRVDVGAATSAAATMRGRTHIVTELVANSAAPPPANQAAAPSAGPPASAPAR